jgi:hypothetical protein
MTPLAAEPAGGAKRRCTCSEAAAARPPHVAVPKLEAEPAVAAHLLP